MRCSWWRTAYNKRQPGLQSANGKNRPVPALNDKTGRGGHRRPVLIGASAGAAALLRAGYRRLRPSAGEDSLWNIFALEAVGGEFTIRKPRERFEPMRLRTGILKSGKEGAKDSAEPLQEGRGLVMEKVECGHAKSPRFWFLFDTSYKLV